MDTVEVHSPEKIGQKWTDRGHMLLAGLPNLLSQWDCAGDAISR